MSMIMDNSCYTCRRRRIECEMTEPPCKKCKKAGLECFQKRPFRWVQGAAFRGKKKVSSVKDASVSVTKLNLESTRRDGSCTRIINYAESIADDDASLEYGEDTPGPRNLCVDNVLVNPDDPYASSLDKVSKYYLYYYSKCVCKLFVMYDSKRNPLRNLIPAALSDSVLLTSIIALSARHMANGGQSFYELGTSTLPALTDEHHNALWFKYKAIQELSHALSDQKLYKNDTAIASAFLLIFLDLLESGSDKWNIHLEGVKKWITQIQPMGSRTGTEQGLGETVEGIRSFIIRQIYLIDTLGATYTRPRLLSNTPPLQEPTTLLQMSLDKSYLGCPEFLLDALRSFSICRDMLAGSDPLEEGSLQSSIENVSIVLNLTQNFDCRAWASNLPQLDTHSTHDTNMLSTLAEAYKAGALIYGRRVSDAFVKETTPLNNLVRDLIAIIEVMRCDEALFKCILWPMFVAGLESQQQDQRDFVISCLEKFWFETKCINVVNAANILRRFWKMGDTQQTLHSQWVFNIGQLGRDWLLI